MHFQNNMFYASIKICRLCFNSFYDDNNCNNIEVLTFRDLWSWENFLNLNNLQFQFTYIFVLEKYHRTISRSFSSVNVYCIRIKFSGDNEMRI